MLQQTQVSRVIDKFTAFMARFPDVRSLASAQIDDVTAMWSGLGYYRRARNLYAAAVACVDRFGAQIPNDVDDLLSLPGVGRYTAGAVASIAFEKPVPAVDGNVQRVLMRLEGVTLAPTSKEAQRWVWQRAAELVGAASSAGEWNEALMELGATACTPKSPKCAECPLAASCVAREKGLQARIPAPKPRRKPTDLHHAVALVRNELGHVLMEQRPAKGMWAGLWQPPTVEDEAGPPSAARLRREVGASRSSLLASFEFQTTHRTVKVQVYEARGVRSPLRGQFVDPANIHTLGVSNLSKRVLAMM